jgi:hypothetical protein
MAKIATIGSIAGNKQPKLESSAQYSSNEVSTPCFAVSDSVRYRGERPMIAGHFA